MSAGAYNQKQGSKRPIDGENASSSSHTNELGGAFVSVPRSPTKKPRCTSEALQTTTDPLTPRPSHTHQQDPLEDGKGGEEDKECSMDTSNEKDQAPAPLAPEKLSDMSWKQRRDWSLTISGPLPVRDTETSTIALLSTLSSRGDILVELEEMGSKIKSTEIAPTGYEFEYMIKNMTKEKWKNLNSLISNKILKKLPKQDSPILTTPKAYQEYADLSIIMYTSKPGPTGTYTPVQVAQDLAARYPTPLRIYPAYDSKGKRINGVRIVYQKTQDRQDALAFKYLKVNQHKFRVAKYHHPTPTLLPATEHVRRGENRERGRPTAGNPQAAPQ
jgi:hypothetical protein